MMQLTPEASDSAKIAMAVDLLRSRHAIRLRACGTSMLPALWPGDLLTIAPFIAAQAVAGDIVLVVRDDRFFIHRLTQIGGGTADWITRGDAMAVCDPPVSVDQIIGRVSKVRRNDREFMVPQQLPMISGQFAKLIAHSNFLRNAFLRAIALRQRLTRQKLTGQNLRAMISVTPSSRQPQSAAPLFEK